MIELSEQRRLQNKLLPPSATLCELSIKNFRCFAHKELVFSKRFVLIFGNNGAGKSSLLEAIYFATYAHSFRTRSPVQMIREGQAAFSIKMLIGNSQATKNELFVGIEPRRKLLKINNVQTKKHSQFSEFFNCISLTQEDMGIVSDSPENRRLFLNQSFFIEDQNNAKIMKSYKKILEQRNALLANNLRNDENLRLWTEQLWSLSATVQKWRGSFIESLNKTCNQLLEKYLPESGLKINLDYKPKQDCQRTNFQEFCKTGYASLLQKETALGRTMFGAHLDDFAISIFNRCARSFASRGEQKLVTLLLKYATVEILQNHGKQVSCILIDDFLTDLDQERLKKCQQIIFDFNIQTIITMPIIRSDFFEKNDKIEEIFLN